MSNILNVLSQISAIKKTELILPIARTEAIVTPLTVGDDLTLKSSVLSPANLDMDLIQLIYDHTEFVKPQIEDTSEKEGTKKKKNSIDGPKFYKPKFQKFLSEISHIDKLMLMWGIYKSTYDTLGERTITCENCKEEFKEDIDLDSLIQEDSITVLEDEKHPFSKYIELVTIPIDEWILEFECSLPTMKRYNNILSMIPISQVQENLEKIRSAFDTTHLMALFTQKFAVYPNKNPEQRVETVNLQEIMAALNKYVKITVADEFMKQYDKLFGNYMVKFYKPITCPSCKDVHDYNVDIEFEFFRRSLFSGGQSE